jgi:signal transduction histidine kinase
MLNTGGIFNKSKNTKLNVNYLEKAEQLYRRALAILEKHGETASVIIDYNQLGSVLAKQGKRAEARQCYAKALAMAEQTGNDEQTLKASDALADLLAGTSPREALAYRSSALRLQRKIFNRESEEQLNNFTIESEVAEKDAQISLQEARLKSQRIIHGALATALLFALAAFALFFYAYTMKRRRNEELTKANAMKDKFFSIISHDMKNPVIAQRDMLTSLVENVDRLNKAAIFDIGSEMLMAQKELLDMITNLLDWSRLQMGSVSCTPIRLDMNALTEKVESQTRSQLDRKRIALRRDIPAGTIVTADRNMLIIIMRNLVSNAAKYSHEGGEIRLKASPAAAGRVRFSVEDDGIGMSRDTQARLFALGTAHSAKGTRGEQGTGLGLIICREMLQRHNTELHVESEEGKGTKFWFEL